MNVGEDVTKQGTDPWKSSMNQYRTDIAWIRAFLCANIALSGVTLVVIIVKLL